MQILGLDEDEARFSFIWPTTLTEYAGSLPFKPLLALACPCLPLLALACPWLPLVSLFPRWFHVVSLLRMFGSQTQELALCRNEASEAELKKSRMKQRSLDILPLGPCRATERLVFASFWRPQNGAFAENGKSSSCIKGETWQAQRSEFKGTRPWRLVS